MAALRAELATYLHGIEIDPVASDCCAANVAHCLADLGVDDIAVDLVQGNALTEHRYDDRMDYVVGNPPYVRVHNLEGDSSQVKSFSFATGGMTDLYLAFFEVGFAMLQTGGRLCYITPSSWLNSLAGQNFRNHIRFCRELVALIDLGHFQPFAATTYTIISLFEKGRRGTTFDYYRYDGARLAKQFVSRLDYERAFIAGALCLAADADLEQLRAMTDHRQTGYAIVKNGFATLADDVFIADVFPFADFVIPVIKASTGRWRKAFFPYTTDGKPLRREEIFSHTEVAAYLEAHKAALLKGAPDAPAAAWYLYGRTQALRDVAVEKIAINTTIRDVASIKLNRVPAGAGLYSGLYILTRADYATVASILLSEDFVRYVALLGKYKSGGYYTFNSKDLERYLNYKLGRSVGRGDEDTASAVRNKADILRLFFKSKNFWAAM